MRESQAKPSITSDCPGINRPWRQLRTGLSDCTSWLLRQVLLVRPSSGIVASALSVDPWKPGLSVNVTLREFVASWSEEENAPATAAAAGLDPKQQQLLKHKDIDDGGQREADPPYHFKVPSTGVAEEWLPADAELPWFHQHAAAATALPTDDDLNEVRKRHFLRHLYIKCIILPRQAQDKHRENSKKNGVFSQETTIGGTSQPPATESSSSDRGSSSGSDGSSSSSSSGSSGSGSLVFSHGERLRKERALWFLGPRGSGPFFHLHPAAYNALLYGERRWFVYPPHGLQRPPSVPMPQWASAYDAHRTAAAAAAAEGMQAGAGGGSNATEVGCAGSSAQATDGSCDAAAGAVAAGPDARSAAEGDMVWDPGWESISECVQEGGDVLFIPSGWHHAVLNTQESVGIALELGDNLQLVDAVLRAAA